MQTLVIGGTRFIGAQVVKLLHDNGADITVFHRGTSNNPLLPESIEHIHDPAAQYPITRFPDALRRDWDIVVHMVAMGAADAQAAMQMFAGRVGRFVLVSSCDVYRAYGRLTQIEAGLPDPVPLQETAALRTVLYPYRGMESQLGIYARDYDKILVERAVRNAHGLDWTILRLPKVYGPGDNGDLATVYGFAAVPDWRWTHGHVRNVAGAIVAAAVHDKARNEIFNVGELQTPTTGERLARLPPADRAAPELPPFDYRQSLVLDTQKIRALIGHADALDEVDAMRDTVAATREIAR